MTYRPRATCKRCGISRTAAGGLSRAGNCAPCGRAAMLGNLEDLAGHRGPYWLHYLDRLTAAVARLWGETDAPDRLPAVTDQDQSPLEEQWPAG